MGAANPPITVPPGLSQASEDSLSSPCSLLTPATRHHRGPGGPRRHWTREGGRRGWMASMFKGGTVAEGLDPEIHQNPCSSTVRPSMSTTSVAHTETRLPSSLSLFRWFTTYYSGTRYPLWPPSSLNGSSTSRHPGLHGRHRYMSGSRDRPVRPDAWTTRDLSLVAQCCCRMNGSAI